MILEHSDRRIFRSAFLINLILFLFLSKLNLIERLLTMVFFLTKQGDEKK